MNLRHFGTFGLVAAIFLACSDDSANDASSGAGTDAGSGADGANGVDAGDGAKEPDAPDDGGSSPDGSPPSDGGQDASVCLSDAGGAGGGVDDQPFSCTPNVAAQGNPTYVLGGARAPFQGGFIEPGLYRATKATNTYVEDAPGDCNGKTPPAPTTYAAEMEFRPTHLLLRSAGITVAGSWTSCDNKLMATLECPSAGTAPGFGYTAIGGTLVRDSGTTNYVDGGCRYGLVYEFVKQ